MHELVAARWDHAVARAAGVAAAAATPAEAAGEGGMAPTATAGAAASRVRQADADQILKVAAPPRARAPRARGRLTRGGRDRAQIVLAPEDRQRQRHTPTFANLLAFAAQTLAHALARLGRAADALSVARALEREWQPGAGMHGGATGVAHDLQVRSGARQCAERARVALCRVRAFVRRRGAWLTAGRGVGRTARGTSRRGQRSGWRRRWPTRRWMAALRRRARAAPAEALASSARRSAPRRRQGGRFDPRTPDAPPLCRRGGRCERGRDARREVPPCGSCG